MQLYWKCKVPVCFTCGFVVLQSRFKHGSIVFVLLHTETGKTVSTAISSLQEHGVRVEIILVTLSATPQGENFKVTYKEVLQLTAEMYTVK